MHTLVRLTGGFPIDQLKRLISQAEVLANQPLLELQKIHTDRNPKFNYRMISVSKKEHGIKYYVADMGHARGFTHEVCLGEKFYSEEDVEKLSKG